MISSIYSHTPKCRNEGATTKHGSLPSSPFIMISWISSFRIDSSYREEKDSDGNTSGGADKKRWSRCIGGDEHSERKGGGLSGTSSVSSIVGLCMYPVVWHVAPDVNHHAQVVILRRLAFVVWIVESVERLLWSMVTLLASTTNSPPSFPEVLGIDQEERHTQPARKTTTSTQLGQNEERTHSRHPSSKYEADGQLGTR